MPSAITLCFVISSSTPRPIRISIFGLISAEKKGSDQSNKIVFPSLMVFVGLVLGFLPWCSSKGDFYIPVFGESLSVIFCSLSYLLILNFGMSVLLGLLFRFPYVFGVSSFQFLKSSFYIIPGIFLR